MVEWRELLHLPYRLKDRNMIESYWQAWSGLVVGVEVGRVGYWWWRLELGRIEFHPVERGLGSRSDFCAAW